MESYEAIRKYRILNGLTQKDVAEKIGMTHSGYAKYERGERKITLDFLIKVLPIINMPTNAYSTSDDDYYDMSLNYDYYERYTTLSKMIISKKDSMTKEELENAAQLFRATYYQTEDEKKKIISVLHPSDFDSIVKAYNVEFLYKK